MHQQVNVNMIEIHRWANQWEDKQINDKIIGLIVRRKINGQRHSFGDKKVNEKMGVKQIH